MVKKIKEWFYWKYCDIYDWIRWHVDKPIDMEKREYIAMVDGEWECPKCKEWHQPFGGEVHHYIDGRPDEWKYGGPPIKICPLCDYDDYVKEVERRNEIFWANPKNVEWYENQKAKYSE